MRAVNRRDRWIASGGGGGGALGLFDDAVHYALRGRRDTHVGYFQNDQREFQRKRNESITSEKKTGVSRRIVETRRKVEHRAAHRRDAETSATTRVRNADRFDLTRSAR